MPVTGGCAEQSTSSRDTVMPPIVVAQQPAAATGRAATSTTALVGPLVGMAQAGAPLVSATLVQLRGADPAPLGRALRILVVDDALSNRSFLKRMMEKRLPACIQAHPLLLSSSEFMDEGTVDCIAGSGGISLEIDCAEDGHLAVEAVFGNFPACLHKYDAITMDAQMPVLDGFLTTRTLRAFGYMGPIYGVTGNTVVRQPV